MGEGEAQSWDTLPVPLLKSAATSSTTFDAVLHVLRKLRAYNNIHPANLVIAAELVGLYIFALFQHHLPLQLLCFLQMADYP